MIAWGREKDIQREVANVPNGWLDAFAVAHKADTRKLGASQNSTLLFRSEAVLAAVEGGETVETMRGM